MKILYYDCFSGISGDMNLGALLDLGVDPAYLREELSKLNIGSFETGISREKRRGISGTRFEVLPAEDALQEHRHYSDIVRMVRESDLSESVKNRALAIFEKVAEAESKVHECILDEVHFHEVGAIDSIVDIVGAALCLDYLKVDRIFSSPVEVGGGFVRCAHGILPVPAPATSEILRGIPTRWGAVPFETTTPTGAAILAASVHSFTDKIEFVPEKIGYGIGRRDTDIPNVLRIFLGESLGKETVAEEVTQQDAWMVECNIDDMNPERYESVIDALFEKGALDVFLTPMIMKKSRPAVTVSILCESEKIHDLQEVLWLETTTFGVRSYRVTKTMMKREFASVETKYGPLTLKHGIYRGRRIKSKPEYEDCRRLAREQGVSLREILDHLPCPEVSDDPIK